MEYEKWPHKFISPQSIDLDPDNPRLPGLPHDANQAEVFREMFEAGKVKEMIRSIAKSGYFPDQQVVVIRKPGTKGKFLVVEGNRRVCACRVLQKPSLAPAKQGRFITKWKDSLGPSASSFSKIPVVVAPSRTAATELIVSRHLNQAPVRAWSRFAQGKFAINALEGGQDLDDVQKETGLNMSDIKKAVQEARLFDVFLKLDWNEEEKSFLMESVDSFPIEALSRVLKSPATSDRIGKVNFNEKGWPEFNWEESLIQPFLKRLVYDSIPHFSPDRKAKLNSRTANNKDQIADYIDRLPEEVRPTSSKKTTPATDFVQEDEKKTSSASSKQAPKTKPKPRSKRLYPALSPDIECNLKHDKARSLLEELQVIKPEDYPHGTAFLIRSLLEISLIARMRHAHTWKDFIAKYQITEGFIPGLEKMIKFAASCDKTIPDENVRKAFRNEKAVPRVFLNLATHNDHHILVPNDVRDIATRLEPLLRFLLSN